MQFIHDAVSTGRGASTSLAAMRRSSRTDCDPTSNSPKAVAGFIAHSAATHDERLRVSNCNAASSPVNTALVIASEECVSAATNDVSCDGSIENTANVTTAVSGTPIFEVGCHVSSAATCNIPPVGTSDSSPLGPESSFTLATSDTSVWRPDISSTGPSAARSTGELQAFMTSIKTRFEHTQLFLDQTAPRLEHYSSKWNTLPV